MRVYPLIKRFLDVIVSLSAIIIVGPFLVMIVALVIKLDSKGPILFRQKRIGKNKREFYILKFRTMHTEAPRDMPTHMFQNPQAYISKSGNFLRKTSLDELPQMLNILKGEMSLIGPRPALWNQYELIQQRDECGANDISPGLTGWAQINGRDELTASEKAEFDGEYAKNLSLIFDLKVIFLTISTVMRSKGVREGAVTTSKQRSS